MKKLFIVLLSFSLCIHAQDQIVLEEMQARDFAKMPLLVGLLSSDHELKKISDVIKQDLEFTHQFDVTIFPVAGVEAKK